MVWLKVALGAAKLAHKGLKAYKKSKNIKSFKNNPDKFKKLSRKDQTEAINADINKFVKKSQSVQFNKGALLAVKKIIKDKIKD